MYHYIILLLFILFTSKVTSQKTAYFDTLNKPISKRQFIQLKKTYKYLEIPGEKENQRALTVRYQSGKITSLSSFYDRLDQTTNAKQNRNNIFVIVYHPGKDRCNSSGSSTRKSIQRWYNKMEIGANAITPTNTLYFYKDSTDLFKKNDGFKTWHKDPDDFLQYLFFKHHYPCNSFVIISPTGEFISYFGEFSKGQVWEYLTLLGNRN